MCNQENQKGKIMIKTCIYCGKQFETDEPYYNIILAGRGNGKTIMQAKRMIKENCCSETCCARMWEELSLKCHSGN